MRSFPPLLLLLAAAVAPVATGESVVWFSDGRSMTVDAVRFEGAFARLELGDGSSLVVPAMRVERHEARPAPPPVRRPAPPQPAWAVRAGSYAETIRAAARRYELDPALLVAMAEVESGFDPAAVSHKGAQGLLQLMPATAARFGVLDSFDPTQNVDGGARYLSWLLERFAGDARLALAGYNAGEGAVDRYDGVPPYPETERYVELVLARLESFRAGTR